ncbi:MAG: HisA/HisF-related TIM barrel protein, partial [Candidatus Heimdallarchaeota archaeon]
TEKVYNDNPIDVLNFWINQGAKRLHIIDLDGAWGSNMNKELLKQMISESSGKSKIQIGGGIRSINSAVELIKLGVDRVILGTLAISNPRIIKTLADQIGKERIIIAVDYKDGTIATHGWTVESRKDPFKFGKKLEKLGAGFILFSSIEADGTLSGPDITNISKMVREVKKLPIYVAGGVRDTEDLLKLKEIGVKGVIIGKAFYERYIPFSIIKNSKYDD